MNYVSVKVKLGVRDETHRQRILTEAYKRGFALENPRKRITEAEWKEALRYLLQCYIQEVS